MSRIFERNNTWFLDPAVLDKSALSTCYYHFLYGLWIPLLNLCRRKLFSADQRVLILHVGPFTSQIMELNDARLMNIQIIPDIGCLSAMEHYGSHISHFVLDSLEAYFWMSNRYCVRPAAWDKDLFDKISNFGVENFFEPVEAPEILIIDRAPADGRHGATTRRIVNIDELAGAIRNHFGCSVNIMTFEGMTMSQQLSLFRSAKMVVAQHGSVLGHTIWMRPEASGVVELVPPKFQKEGWEYFSLLCSARKIPRVEIRQDSPFSPVPIDEVIDALQKIKNLVD